jgi:hypothetical protein
VSSCSNNCKVLTNRQERRGKSFFKTLLCAFASKKG